MDDQLHHDARASIVTAALKAGTPGMAFRLQTRWRMRIWVRQSAEQ
ncbi:hypothetical protein [Azospirillum canadense]|nr:hypothetical protein [Azospirillum canadense]MCW2243284.1 hypothetical protein [Azospirillum canadense]